MPAGRPTLYNADIHPDWAWALAMYGKTNQEIADEFGINIDTFHEWKKKYREFSESLKEGKQKTDSKVVRSLLQRAMGYEYKERKTVAKRIGGKIEVVEVTTSERHMPADVGAMAIWLKNRQTAHWCDKP